MIYEESKMKFTLASVAISLLFCISACSLEANIVSQTDTLKETLDRKSPDLTYGEIVTTSGGFQLTGVFGESSEKTKSITNNEWQFEGAFYEH